MPEGRHSAPRGTRRARVSQSTRGRRSAGPRRAALKRKRKDQTRRGLFWGVVAGAMLLVLVLAVVLWPSGGEGREPKGSPGPTAATQDSVDTVLVVGTNEDGSAARWLDLVALDGDKASVVYIPAHTAVEIPGRGLQGVGEALRTGGIPLLLVTLENMLGVPIDHYVEISEAEAGPLFEATGDLTVEVPSEVRVPVGEDQARLLLTEGTQRLSSPFTVELLYTIGLDGDEAELGSRHLAFWDALHGTFASDPGALRSAVEQASSVLTDSDMPAPSQAAFFEGLAGVEDTRLTLTSLPVEQQVAGDGELYSVDAAELETFVAQTIGTSGSDEDEVQIQILNGVGTPGIGQDVASKLVGEGYKVILSGNARPFNRQQTLLVVYDSTPEAQAIAEQARELLGVGAVQISRQPQGIVDLTIVVGKDFLGAPN